MSAVFTYDVTVAPQHPSYDELEDAFNAHRHARDAADKVLGRLTRAQSTGPEGLPPGDEFLLDKAEVRRVALERLLGVRASRRQVVVPRPPVEDWRNSVARMDWSKGRSA